MSSHTRRLLGGSDMHLDANRINSRQKIPAVNRLEEWGRDGVIYLTICERAQQEAAHGHDACRRAKAMGQPTWLTLANTPEELAFMQRIEKAVFPNGATEPSQRNDVEILFCARKYHAILVTNDGGSKSQPQGILGSRAALAELGIKVMTAEEAVARVIYLLLHRDRNAIDCWKVIGEPLPDWVGQDAPEIADEIQRYRDAE